MSNYGIQPTGYVRKPISVILADLEAAMVTEFGPGVIQTPQSPLGQLNGLMADLLAEIDERNLDLYQSYDPDQAEGVRLEMLGRARLLYRNGRSDLEFRQAITNEGQTRVDVQDLQASLRNVEGVTFVNVTLPGDGVPEVGAGSLAVAVIGGSDSEVAEAVRRGVAPGISTFGNVRLSTELDGYCRSISVIRPLPLEVQMVVTVKRSRDRSGCPAPSTSVLQDYLAAGWLETRLNGFSPSYYRIRSILEATFSNVEVLSIQSTSDGVEYGLNADVPVSFIEIAELDLEVVEA